MLVTNQSTGQEMELDLKSLWGAVIEKVSTDAPQHRAFLTLTKPLGLIKSDGGSNLLLAAPNVFAKDVLESRLRVVLNEAPNESPPMIQMLNYSLGKGDYPVKFGLRWSIGSGFPFTQTLGFYEKFNFDKGIDANYANIKKNGISDWQLRHMEKQEIVELKETLSFMMKHYIDLEQYERCGLLKSELEKIEMILERVS